MTASRTPTTRRGWLRPLALAPVLALITLMAWGLSSPVGSSPDDDFHLASIWCAVGQKADACDTTSDPATRVVPRDLIVTSVCYAQKASESAACQGADFGTDPESTVGTQRGNFEGLYPPVYYTVMSPLVGPNIDLSVQLIRLANSLLYVGMATALFLLLPRHRRWTLVWSLVVTAIPLGVFLVASTNPSSWAVISAGTLWIALLGYFETTGRRRIGLGAIALVSTVMGAGARADAAVFAGLAIVVVMVLAFRATRTYVLAALFPTALALIAVAFFLSARQSAAASTGLGAYGTGPFDLKALISENFLNVPYLWAGVFGQWSLGWLDTSMPAVVWVGSSLCFIGLVFAGLGWKQPRKSVAAGLVLAALWIFPTVLLVQSQARVGEAVQPRYIFPLVVILAGIALLHGSTARPAPSRLQIGVLIGALSLANSIALHTNLRRYVTGVDVTGWNLDSQREWWWNMQVTPMMVWIAGTGAFVVLLVLIASPFWPGRADTEVERGATLPTGAAPEAGDVAVAQPTTTTSHPSSGLPPAPAPLIA